LVIANPNVHFISLSKPSTTFSIKTRTRRLKNFRINMAPSASDPKDLKLVLNPARRKALTILIGNIVSHMRSRIEQSFDSSPATEAAPLFTDRSSSRDHSRSPLSDPEEEARQQRLEARLERTLSNPKLQALKKDALFYFDHWAAEVRGGLRKFCDGPEDPRSEQRRREWMAQRNPPPPSYSRTSSSDTKNPELEAAVEAKKLEDAKNVAMLQSLYHPIPTRLTTISQEDRICVVSCMVLLLLSLGHYSAHSRVLLCYLTSAFALPLNILVKEETEIAQTLLLASKALSADAETQKRQAENASSRRWKVGLSAVAGAALIGITGGLAAPVVAGAIGGIMGGVGLGGVASFLGIFAMNGALVGSLFGAFGGKMTGEMVDAYAKEVSDFKFLPVAEEWGPHGTKEENEVERRRLRVTVGINGWLDTEDDVVRPWRVLGRDSEAFALRYEMGALLELGKSLQNMVSSYAWSYVKLEILKRTVLATLWSALWPIYLLKMATSIDNPFAVARNRSEKAGEVLADALINKAQGERPVTLIGYSLGARVIYSCLKSLAERKAFGLVETVVFIGSPIPSNGNNWRVMRSVVSGKVINVYSENDYILAFLYRATSIQFGVAGLQAIGVDGVSDLDLSKEVSGHLRYPELIGQILKRAGFEGVVGVEGDIENDIKEIQLLDFEEEEAKVGDARGLHQGNLPEMVEESEPVRSELGSGVVDRGRDVDVDELTRGMAGISVAPVINKPKDGVKNTSSAMDDLAELMGSTSLNPTTTTATSHPNPRTQISAGSQSTTQNRDVDSESDDGGIQMVDNDSDSDGELHQIPGVPIPDDDYPEPGFDPRDMGKVAVFEEQKSLGSFPKIRGESSQSPSGSQDRGNESRLSGSGKRVTATGIGFY
jgi:hypothetical protein